MNKGSNLIGVFDSGVGGLSVLRAIRLLLPSQPVVYFGDQAHVPYGVRKLDEVREFSRQITAYLIRRGARLIVVACNTASVAALKTLREDFPGIPFVGMEPAVKPAAEQTRSGVVGVLATYATFHTSMYASVVERFAQGVTILEDHCPGLVNQIENGDLEGPETRKILMASLLPMIGKGADTIVMGCTHYPFVIPVIQSIVGEDVRVIDPAPAIARQVQRLLESNNLLNQSTHPAGLKFITTGDPKVFKSRINALLSEDHLVKKALWQDGRII